MSDQKAFDFTFYDADYEYKVTVYKPSPTKSIGNYRKKGCPSKRDMNEALEDLTEDDIAIKPPEPTRTLVAKKIVELTANQPMRYTETSIYKQKHFPMLWSLWHMGLIIAFCMVMEINCLRI